MPIRTDPTLRGPSPAVVPRSLAVRDAAVRHTAAQRGATGQAVARPAPRRADPTATRLAVAAGGIATVSALIAAIAGGAIPPTANAATPLAGAAASDPTQATVRYVYLQSGQAAPQAVVATPLASPAPGQVQAPVVTRQSGALP